MEEEGDQGQFRILMVSDFFHPNTGGVESHIYQLSQCLLARRHHVVVLTHAYAAVQGIKHLTNGLRVYYVPRMPIYQQATLPTIFGSFSILREIILRERISLVHCHQAFSTLAHEAALHARTMGLRVVFTDHSLFGFADASSILLNKVLKYSLADVHAVICVSHISKENTVLRACIPPKRVYVIPNAVDASRFRPLPLDSLEHCEKARKTAKGEITVVVMSRLVYRKGIDLLAAVLPEICRRHPKLKFIIGGDGPKKALLEQVIAAAKLDNKVALLGRVSPEKVRDVLVRGHIFLNCSLTEAFCMALVEAAAAGLLSVSTCVGGVPEVLPPDMLLLAQPSPEGVIAAVDEAVRCILSGEVGNDAHEQHKAVASMYSWHAIAERTERAYRDAMSSRRDDSMTARLGRYHRCGKWFGKICCCVAAVDWLYWQWLKWRQPCSKRTASSRRQFPSTYLD